MRTFDLTPLYRSTVGFDRLFSMLDQAAGVESTPSYPPYNIERTGENAYRISIAVAGFVDQELSIEAKEQTLTVRGDKRPEPRTSPSSCIRASRPAPSSAASSSPTTSRPGRAARARPAAHRPRPRDPRGG